ncbi:MAG TPA: phage holin family protein [Novosphingobium sp.]|nr:phage holin family protein [Novosphingobium sp.]
MDDEPVPLVNTNDAAERSLVDDVRQLIDDGRTLAEAEYAYQKSRAAVAGDGVKGAAAYGGLAIALVLFALVALTIGLLIALTPWLTAWGATAVVTVGLLLAAALSALVAKRRWSAMTSAISGSSDEAA